MPPDNDPFSDSRDYRYEPNAGTRYRDWLVEVKTKLAKALEDLDDHEKRIRDLERFKTAILSQATLISIILSSAIGLVFTWLADKLK